MAASVAAARAGDWGWRWTDDIGTLPPPLTDVLVCYWDDIDEEETVVMGFWNADGWFISHTDTPRISHPIAWMPLPSPVTAAGGGA